MKVRYNELKIINPEKIFFYQKQGIMFFEINNKIYKVVAAIPWIILNGSPSQKGIDFLKRHSSDPEIEDSFGHMTPIYLNKSVFESEVINNEIIEKGFGVLLEFKEVPYLVLVAPTNEKSKLNFFRNPWQKITCCSEFYPKHQPGW